MKKDNRTALVVDNHSLSAFKWFPIDKDLMWYGGCMTVSMR